MYKLQAKSNLNYKIIISENRENIPNPKITETDLTIYFKKSLKQWVLAQNGQIVKNLGQSKAWLYETDYLQELIKSVKGEGIYKEEV